MPPQSHRLGRATECFWHFLGSVNTDEQGGRAWPECTRHSFSFWLLSFHLQLQVGASGLGLTSLRIRPCRPPWLAQGGRIDPVGFHL